MRKTIYRLGIFVVAGVLCSARMTEALAAEVTLRDLTGKDAPAGAVWLDTKDLSSVKVGFGTVGAGKACDGKNPISIGKQVFAHGIGVHAESVAEVSLNKKATRFVAAVGVDDQVNTGGTVAFEVWVDKVKKAESGVMRCGDAPKLISVDLTGAAKMKLVVSGNGDGLDNDHGDWGGAAVFGPGNAVSVGPDVPYKALTKSVERWQDWHFGMFIHWGPVSLTEQEISWSRSNTNPNCPNNGPTQAAVYDELYKKFDPNKFNATEWVATAKAAGMKYMVLTVKHCDGFLLWDSKVSDYNIMHTPFKRDICAELAVAARKAGMGLGWYFSPPDWKDPGCRSVKNAEFVKRMQAELTELLTKYGTIDILWFDCDGASVPWDQDETYALVRRLQPGIVINNRLDSTSAGYSASQIGPWADFYTPELHIGGFDIQRPWESCVTVCNQWAWGGPGDRAKSSAECLGMLIRCAGGGGNMLMNVGPRPDGIIDPGQTTPLKEVGTWLEMYGESIYGTRGGPFKPDAFGVSTHKLNTIYIHILNWPGDTLELPDIPAKIVRSVALTGGTVAVTQGDGRISISLKTCERQPVNTVVKLELDRKAGEIVSPRGLAAGKPVKASSSLTKGGATVPEAIVDGRSDTRWSSDHSDPQWVAVDLGGSQRVSRVELDWENAFAKELAIEVSPDGVNWKEVQHVNDSGGGTQIISFESVVTRWVRMRGIKRATQWGYSLFEMRVFP